MSAPKSTAVMNRRRDPASALDFFPTPPWATRALLEEIMLPWVDAYIARRSALDPCCGAGHMVLPLAEYFGHVDATDVHDWGFGRRRDLDFLTARPGDFTGQDWLIYNPPFVLAEQFFDRAYRLARLGVAMLLRLNWLEGGERFGNIFEGDLKPTLVCPFAERVPMIEGCWDPEASSATAYGWFVWDFARGPVRRSEIMHIPPGMAQRHSYPRDEALANRGEAARRAAARKAAERGDVLLPDLFGGAAP